MKRQVIVRVLRETGALLELRGENPFRVRAYENAAKAILGLVEQPEERLEAGTISEIPGIGPALAAVIAEIVQTGASAQHEALKAQYPAGILELFRVPGLGTKRIRLVHEQLGVSSLADLDRACRDGRLAALPGFGARTAEKIAAALAQIERQGERHRFDEAERYGESLLATLRGVPGVERAELAGGLRRRAETIGDVDLVAAVPAAARDAVVDAFLAAVESEEIVARSADALALRLGGGFLVDLRLLESDDFAAGLLRFTGSVEHLAALRRRADEAGLALDEQAVLRRGGSPVAAADEAELYRHLGLHWIPPEMREGLDEVERAAAGPLPRLVEVGDLRGTFHVHTSWSDGTASVEQMARAAAARGWEYLGIADHSRAAAYARGLQPDQVRQQWLEIDAWNARGEAPHLFKGTESDVLADGALDYPDDLLLEFDFVVVSVHSRFRMSREEMTARLVRAVSHPCTTFLGHSTGRLLLARDGYELDLDAVLEAAAANGVVPEVNANPRRLDLDWRPLRRWLAAGQPTSIHPDAHAPVGLDDVRFGVGVARKAGARAEDVLNTQPLESIAARLRERRERARRLLGGSAS
jgi:DNA polymerase (family 10)